MWIYSQNTGKLWNSANGVITNGINCWLSEGKYRIENGFLIHEETGFNIALIDDQHIFENGEYFYVQA